MTAVVAASWAVKHARDRQHSGPWMHSTGSNGSGGNTNGSSSYTFNYGHGAEPKSPPQRSMEIDNSLRAAAPGIKYGEVVALGARDSSNGQFQKGDIGQAAYQDDGSVVIQWPNGTSSRTSWPNQSWYRGYPLRPHPTQEEMNEAKDVLLDLPEPIYGRRRSSTSSSTSAGSTIVTI